MGFVCEIEWNKPMILDSLSLWFSSLSFFRALETPIRTCPSTGPAPLTAAWVKGTDVHVYTHVYRKWPEVRTSTCQVQELQISCVDWLPSFLLSQVVPSEPFSTSLRSPVWILQEITSCNPGFSSQGKASYYSRQLLICHRGRRKDMDLGDLKGGKEEWGCSSSLSPLHGWICSWGLGTANNLSLYQ